MGVNSQGKYLNLLGIGPTLIDCEYLLNPIHLSQSFYYLNKLTEINLHLQRFTRNIHGGAYSSYHIAFDKLN